MKVESVGVKISSRTLLNNVSTNQSEKQGFDKTFVSQNINLSAASGIYGKTLINFGANFPLNEMKRVPCICCGHIMITPKEFLRIKWPKSVRPLSAKEVFSMIEKQKKLLKNSEKRFLNDISFEVVDNDLPYDELISREDKRVPSLFKNYLGMTKQLSKGEYTKALIDTAELYKEYMHTTELKAFSIIKDLNKKHPDCSINELLEIKRPEALKKLKIKQLEILNRISFLSNEPIVKTNKEVNSVINRHRQLIMGDDIEKPFKRKAFIDDLNSAFEDSGVQENATRSETVKLSPLEQRLVQLAESLPTSSDNEMAFVVKYSGLAKEKRTGKLVPRSPKEIMERLISVSKNTKEHVFATNPEPGEPAGADNPLNWVAECADCNNRRGSIPFYRYIPKSHPDMPQNAQKHIDFVIDLINSGQWAGFDWYPKGIKGTMAMASKDLVKLDLSRLKVKDQPIPPKYKLFRDQTKPQSLSLMNPESQGNLEIPGSVWKFG